MPAGDGNDQNEQAVSPGQLSERRERFHLNLTDEDDNNRGLVGSGQEFYEFQRPQVESNQKFNSINVLSGQRTPSFNVRQVVAQRQLSKLDPINKYYIMGGDRDIRNKITYTPLESNDAYGNESLTPESPNSINVNFNVAGYRRSGPRTVVLGLSR